MTKARYLELFRTHGLGASDIYMIEDEKRQDAIFLLFDEVCDEMLKESEFNAQMPREFIESMERYSSGEPYTVSHFDNVSHRAFYLSDLYDILQLFSLGRR